MKTHSLSARLRSGSATLAWPPSHAPILNAILEGTQQPSQNLRGGEGKEEAVRLRAQAAGPGFVHVVLAFNTHVSPASALLCRLCDALICPLLKCWHARGCAGVLSETKGARFCIISWAIADKHNIYEALSKLLAAWCPHTHSRSGQSCDIPTWPRTRVLGPEDDKPGSKRPDCTNLAMLMVNAFTNLNRLLRCHVVVTPAQSGRHTCKKVSITIVKATHGAHAQPREPTFSSKCPEGIGKTGVLHGCALPRGSLQVCLRLAQLQPSIHSSRPALFSKDGRVFAGKEEPPAAVMIAPFLFLIEP